MSSWWNPTPTLRASEEADRVLTRRQATAAAVATAAAEEATRAPEDANHLRGRPAGRLQTPKERLSSIRSRSRGNSPAPSPQPSPLPQEENAFFNESSTAASQQLPQPLTRKMDEADVERITANAVRIALQQDREERDRQSRIATEAAVAAALANQTSQVQALRRPDLPPFDKSNIEAWIRRLEFAYTRSNVVKAMDKFAFIEKLFNSKDDAKVNAFLNGPQTDSRWTSFLSYLRDKYGKTIQQEVYSLLNGHSRDARRPTELAAYILEQSANVTVDNIRKEVLLKAMPSEVRQHLAAKLDTLDFDKTAIECDKYFDKAGKLKEQANNSSVHSIGVLKQPQQQQQQRQQTHTSPPTAFSSPFSDDETEVNAVRFRQGQKQSFNVSNRSSSRGRSSSNFGGRNSNNTNDNLNQRSNSSNGHFGASGSNNSTSNPPRKHVCHFHMKFGEEAERCEGSWCLLKGKVAPKGQASR